MQWSKQVLLACLVLVLLLGCCGCSKDEILNCYNSILRSASKLALSSDLGLKGMRKVGEDSYVGSYCAEYQRFSGREVLFGGTSIERRKTEFKVAYDLTVFNGSGRLILVSGDCRETLVDTEGEGELNYGFAASDQYLVFEGKGFDGSLELQVSD